MEKIQLAFSCGQDFDAMQPLPCGRFCSMCSRTVIDMTRKTPHEIMRIAKESDAVCGSFLPEQLEPDLVPVEFSILTRLRYYVAVVAAFFGVEIAQLGAKQTHKETTVLVPAESDFASHVKDDPTGRDSRKKRRGKLVKKSNKSSSPDPVAVKSKRKKKFYLSKRFPFIKVRRRRVLGRMTF